MSSKYSVRQVAIADHAEAIAALWARCLRALTLQAAHRRLQHRYLRNPGGVGATLLLQQEDLAEVAGVQCLQSRVFHHGGRRWQVAGLADYAVGESHRTLGPALQLMKRALALGRTHCDWIYGFANEKSAAVCKRSGLQRVGNVERWTRPLRTRELLARRLPAALAAVLAPLADAALWLRDAARPGSARRLRWQDSVHFDAELDALWQRRSSALLLSERSRHWLEWRFAVEVPGRSTVSLARDATGELLGYVVWQREAALAVVVDFLCADPLHDTARLMRGFAWHARGLGGVQRVSLEFFGAPEVSAQLQAAGFVKRHDEMPLYLVEGANPPPPPSCWYVTAFDRDGG